MCEIMDCIVDLSIECIGIRCLWERGREKLVEQNTIVEE